MKTFLVMAPPKAKGAEDLAMKMVFLRDGFSVLAFLYPAIWLLLKRMWVVLICYLLITFSLVLAGSAVSEETALLMALMVSFIIGFEGRALYRWALQRRGWRLAAVVRADSTEEAERRFFAEWLERADSRDGGRGSDGERPDPPVRSAARDRVSGDAPPKPATPVPQIPRSAIGGSPRQQPPEPSPAATPRDTVRTSPFRTVPRTATPDAVPRTTAPDAVPRSAGPDSAAATFAPEPSPELTDRRAAGEADGPAAQKRPDTVQTQSPGPPPAAVRPSSGPAAGAARPAGGTRRLPMFPPKGGR